MLPYSPTELLAFVALGVVFGFLAVFFIRMVEWMGSLKRRYRVLSPEFRYTQIVIVSLLTAGLSFPLVYLRNDSASIINDLFEGTECAFLCNVCERRFLTVPAPKTAT